jgi:hypothetical protein
LELYSKLKKPNVAVDGVLISLLMVAPFNMPRLQPQLSHVDYNRRIYLQYYFEMLRHQYSEVIYKGFLAYFHRYSAILSTIDHEMEMECIN